MRRLLARIRLARRRRREPWAWIPVGDPVVLRWRSLSDTPSHGMLPEGHHLKHRIFVGETGSEVINLPPGTRIIDGREERA